MWKKCTLCLVSFAPLLLHLLSSLLERFGLVLGSLRTTALICNFWMWAESMPKYVWVTNRVRDNIQVSTLCSLLCSLISVQVIVPWDALYAPESLHQVKAVNLNLLGLRKLWCLSLSLPEWALGWCFQHFLLLSCHQKETWAHWPSHSASFLNQAWIQESELPPERCTFWLPGRRTSLYVCLWLWQLQLTAPKPFTAVNLIIRV